jgi:fructosamine-3-kinase
MVDKSVQNHAKGEINRGLDRVANANTERLTNVMSQSTQGGNSFTKGVDKVLEKQAENATKTVEVFANIHETGQHPAPSGGQTSNDGGSGGGWMP